MEKCDQVRMAGNLVEQLEIFGFSTSDISAIGAYMMAHAERLDKYRDVEARPKQQRFERLRVHPN